MDVRGVAGHDDPAADVVGRLPGGVAEPGQPARGAQPDVTSERLVHGGLEQVQGDGRVPVGRRPAVTGNDPHVAGAGNDEHPPARAGGRAERECPGIGQLDVAQQGEASRLGAGEVDPRLLADGAAAAVAACQVPGPDTVLAFGGGDSGDDGLGVLLNGAQLVPAPDVGSQFEGAVLEDLFDPGLRDAQRVRVVGARVGQA